MTLYKKYTKLVFFLFLLLSYYSEAQLKDKFHTEYDKTKSAFENYTSGFTNVFYTLKDTFRVRCKDTGNNNENPMILERLNINRWVYVDSFDYSYCFTNSAACNVKPQMYGLDDFGNFVINYKWKWNKEDESIELLFTYDKTKNTFFKIGYFSGKPIKIKGYKNLYYDVWHNRYNDWSYLFTIKNNERVNLSIAETKVKLKRINSETIKGIPQYISIRKKTNTKDIEILRVNKNRANEFEYGKYWTNNAKQFYNLKSKSIKSQKNAKPEYFYPIQ